VRAVGDSRRGHSPPACARREDNRSIGSPDYTMADCEDNLYGQNVTSNCVSDGQARSPLASSYEYAYASGHIEWTAAT
jgi:hypothetical protein